MNHPPDHRFCSSEAERGLALLMVFVLLMVMILVVGDLLSRSQVKEFATENLVDSHLSYYAENTALLKAEEILFQDMEPPPMKPLDERLLTEEEMLREERSKGTDSFHDYWATFREEEKNGETTLLTTISDEERRFNINTILDPRTGKFIEKRKAFLEVLLKELGVKEAELNGFLDELKDQMDSDDTGKYESDLRNGPFKRLSDLMVCEHVTKELYNGLDYPEGELKLLQDDDEDVIEDFSEESSGNAPIFEKKPMPPYEEWDEDEIFPGLSDVLTVYGDGKINVNTAPLPILKALFGEEDIALDVIVARKEAPFRSVEDLAQVSNTQNGATKYGDMIAFRSNYFRVILHLQQRRVLRKRVSLVSREGSELTTLFRGAIL